MECRRNNTNGNSSGKLKRKRHSAAKARDASPSLVKYPEINDNLSPKRSRNDNEDLRFSSQLLEFYLYGRNSKFGQPLKESDSETKNVKYPPGMFPCTSSIPGRRFGVYCSRFIPVGTWIGPFEGEVIRPEELTADRDNGHMWEIYKDGKLSHYVDGNDTKFSNWMSMIQCARHKEEQNMTVFQYNGNLYYRAFRDILPYTELLVWYDDRYSDSMDIERISMAGSDALSSRISGNAIHAYERNYRRIGNEHLEQIGEVQPNEYFALASLNETNQWRCGQCDQTFTQRVALQMHVCDKSPEKPFQCGQCPASFSNADELRGHVIDHVSDKPFKCGFCGRTFSGSTTLSNHIRTHTGERPFKCRKCGKTFSQSTQLSRHQKSRENCAEKVTKSGQN